MDNQAPERLLRLVEIIGRSATEKRPAIPALVPVSRSTWYAGIGTRFPAPVRLGPNSVAWRKSDIDALVARGVDEKAAA